MIGSVVPRNGRVLILINGAYGRRVQQMCDVLQIPYDVIVSSEIDVIDVSAVKRAVTQNRYSHVTIVHHETTAGVINPVTEIGDVVYKASPSTSYIVDSMSGFGAHDVDFNKGKISYLVSSANKNIEVREEEWHGM